jgi:hypothetical protein
VEGVVVVVVVVSICRAGPAGFFIFILEYTRTSVVSCFGAGMEAGIEAGDGRDGGEAFHGAQQEHGWLRAQAPGAEREGCAFVLAWGGIS